MTSLCVCSSLCDTGMYTIDGGSVEVLFHTVGWIKLPPVSPRVCIIVICHLPTNTHHLNSDDCPRTHLAALKVRPSAVHLARASVELQVETGVPTVRTSRPIQSMPHNVSWRISVCAPMMQE